MPALAVAGVVAATTTSDGLAGDALSEAAGRAAGAHAGVSAGQARAGNGQWRQAAASKASTGVPGAMFRGAAGRARGGAPQHDPRPRAAKRARHPAKSVHHSLSCSGSAVMLPENYATIVSYLTGHGYTRFAAAGIAGNIYQESKGNPESVGTGGGGLIGWTPLPPGLITGSPAADLRTQLAAILAYNRQWAHYLPALNAAASATQAADIYMNYFERPGISAAYNREAAAAAVASACGF